MTHRLTQFGVLLLATAFVGYWALLVYCDVWRPNPPGLLLRLDAGRFVVVDVVPRSAAGHAGFRMGDRILSVEGRPIGGRLDWMAVEANFEIGQPTNLSIDRGGAIVTLAIVPEPGSWQSWRAEDGPELLVIRSAQLVTLLLAPLVALKRPRDSSALVGSAFLATIGIFSVTLPYRLASVWRAWPPPASWLLWIPFMSSVALAGWGLSFFAIFPRVRFRMRAAWWAIWLPLVPGLIGHGLFGYDMVVLGGPSPPWGPWLQSLIAVSVCDIVAALAVLVRNYRQLTDLNERRRVRVLMIGSLVGGVAGTPVVLSHWRASTTNLDQSFLASPFATLGTFLFLALPLSFAYAILRHRLFDLRLMVRQGLRYALARRALVALVPILLAFLGVDLLAHGGEPVGDILRGRVWVYVAIAVIAVVARTQRQGWLESLDRRFFRERYNAQRLLRQVAEDVRHAAGLELVAPTVVSRIEQALHPRFVALLVRDEDGRSYRTVASSPSELAPGLLEADNKVLAMARLLGQPLDIAGSDTEWLARKMPVDDVRRMKASAIELIVPVVGVDGGADALLALGSKRSEEPYTDDDGELLMAIGESVAMRLPTSHQSPVPSHQSLVPSPQSPVPSHQSPVISPQSSVTSHVGRVGGAQLDQWAQAIEGFEECPVCGGCYESGTQHCVTEGAALVPATAPRVLAGRYRLERRLGRGGMGTVYAALDTTLHRQVAAKLVREDLVGLPGAAERFQREARAAAGFAHPNVVTVHDFGVAGGHAFLVMELLDGRTLRQTLVDERRIGPERAVAILRDVAAAVEAAHRRQLIHRDLKPENICLVSQGSHETAKVLDFGIAKFLHGSDPLTTYTSEGVLVGTPLYMAPEQLRGENPDAGWDVWALAVIAFEMLSGSHPFRSAALGPHASDSWTGRMPQGCQPFFTRALAIDRAQRPQSAALFVTELERSLRG